MLFGTAGAGGTEVIRSGDPEFLIVMAAATKKAEQIIDEKLDHLARAMRDEIVDAWNKGQKKQGKN